MRFPVVQAVLVLALLAGASLSEQPAPKTGGKAPASATPAASPASPASPASAAPAPAVERVPAPTPLELPPGTILAVCDSLAEALKFAPRAVVLSRDQFQAMQDEVARLRRQLARPRLVTPAQAVLKGRIDGNLLHLSVEFEFETDQPDTRVRLACSPAQATGVSLDGRVPRLLSGDRLPPRDRPARPEDAAADGEGYLVEIDKPGRHQLTLELVLLLSPLTGGQGFTLDLPRAAVTRLELDLPPGSRDLRLGKLLLAETLLEWKNNRLTGNLGAAERLELSWRAASAGAASPILTADGVVQVKVEPRQLTSEVRLTLRVQSGQVKQWQLLAPTRSRVSVAAADEARLDRIETTDRKQLTLYTLHLKEPSADPLQVTVEHVQPALDPGARKAMTIGPFTVLGAVRHNGSVLVSNLVPDWHLEFTPHGDLTRRGISEEELRRDGDLAAVFRYGPGSERRAALSWLDLEAETVRGQVVARPAHLLRLAADGSRGLRWQVQSTFTVTPRWADVDRFRVQLPEGCEQIEDGSFPLPDRVRSVHHDPAARVVEFRLNRGMGEPSLQPFSVRVEAIYAQPVDDQVAAQASPGLPRPLGTIEQDGAITVQAPANLELLTELPGRSEPRPIPPGLDLVRQSTHELAYRYPRRSPERLEFAWQPYRPPIRVQSVVDVTLLAGETQVVHELQYQLPAGSDAARVTLRLPEVVASSFEVRQGGKLHSLSPGSARTRLASITLNGGSSPALIVSYRCPVVDGTGPLPLAIPEQASGGETRVRLWSESGRLPTGARGWTEQNIEVVPDRPRLPVLVLHASQVDQPLELQLGAVEPVLAALVERVLVRVEVLPAVQHYRVRYRLTHLGARRLDFELPVPAVTANLQVRFDGKRVDYELLPVERPERKGRLIGVRLAPGLVRRPAVLEVVYRLDSDRLPGTALTTPLAAPLLQDEVVSAPMRWQVYVPANRVILAPEAEPGTPRRWGLRGWLPAPRPGLSAADLERWFSGDRSAETAEEVAAEAPPDLVAWQDGAAPVQLIHVPQQLWLLACSLTLVLLGLAAARLPLGDANGQPTVLAWGLLLSVLLAALLLALLRPELAGALTYGCQPGAVVLVMLALLQWVLRERHRRQVVFLPSFTRGRPGSSLLRREGSRPPGEPSTIDVPRGSARPSGDEWPVSPG